ncbi:MAG: hypothetical protein HUU21_18395 [Polyangiaceae bacterium]|nr:hypothetical protein [Polyangiaceae bacterium]NUQ75520.1 hypothetical protein [Polyangiaceae bacterium]
MSKQIHRAPFAITLDGKVVANLVHAHNVDLSALKSLALHQDDELFVGVVLRSSERRFVRDRIENALHDALGWVFGLRARPTPGNEAPGKPPTRSK